MEREQAHNVRSSQGFPFIFINGKCETRPVWTVEEQLKTGQRRQAYTLFLTNCRQKFREKIFKHVCVINTGTSTTNN